MHNLSNCTSCPHNCHADRYSAKLGFCATGTGFSIGSVCIHRGEEPAIMGSKGICNVFFSRCNLQCVYCQNYQISRNTDSIIENNLTLDQVLSQIIKYLNKGCKAVGFVSPSHVVAQMTQVIEALHSKDYHPVIVMNTNAYDKVETLRELENLVNVYLPDFKYMTPEISCRYSGVKNYGEVAGRAIKEMYRQKGSSLITDDDGQAESGLLIRHLVLPGHIDESLKVLHFIADEISTSVHISLMSQYFPTANTKDFPEINRTLRTDEYEQVVEAAQNMGFRRLLIQEMESSSTYCPDFYETHPFEI